MIRRVTSLSVWLAIAMWACTSTIVFAQAGWLRPSVPIAQSPFTLRSIVTPDVATDPDGNAVAIWTELDQAYRGVVYTARFDAATGTWDAPRRMSAPSAQTTSSPQIELDAAGNGLAVWSQTNPAYEIYSARYVAATNTWAAAEVRSTGLADGSRLAMNAAGDAVAVWTVYGALTPGPLPGVYVSRFSASGAAWTAAERLGPSASTGVPTFAFDVAVAASGDATVAWHYSTVDVRRLSATTGVWSPAQPLSGVLPMPGPNQLLPTVRVTGNAAGETAVSWTNGGALEVSRYLRGSGTWTPAFVVASGQNDSQNAVVDTSGNIVVAWHQNAGTTRTLRAARFDTATLSWSPPRDLAPPGAQFALVINFGAPALAVDGHDNVIVLACRSSDGVEVRLVSSFFARAAGTWTATPDLTPAGREARQVALAGDGRGGAVGVWFDYGTLPTFQAMRWTSAPAAPAFGTVTPAPGQVSMAFTPGPVLDQSLAPTGLEYSLDGGATWTPRAGGSTDSPLVLSGLTDGVLRSVRLRMQNTAGAGTATPAIIVGSGTGGQPGAFRVAARDGSRLTFAWTRPAAGLVPDRYDIEGGVNGQVLATVPTSGSATQVDLAVPDGTFFVRVVGASGTARSLPSSDITIGVNGVTGPSAPSAPLGSASGSQLALSWQAVLDGAAPSGVRLDVAGALSTSLDLPATESFTYPAVPAGTYTFTVRALRGAQASAPSSPVTLTFPAAACAPPQSPAAFSLTARNRVVFLDWLPPATGEAVTSYVVAVTGAFTGSLPMTTRTLAAPVPPGSYTVRVAAVGLCGTSAFTAPQTIVVP